MMQSSENAPQRQPPAWPGETTHKPDGHAVGSATWYWEVHLAREAPLTAVLGGLLVVVAGLAVDAFSDSLLWGLFAAAVLIFSLRRFFLPFTMRLDAEGITWPRGGRPRQAAWSDIVRVRVRQRWAWLELRDPPGKRAAAQRGARMVTLHLGRQRAALLARLREHLSPQTPIEFAEQES